jgi:hypothetical protein
MNKKELIIALKELIEEQEDEGGDYDSLYFGVLDLLE